MTVGIALDGMVSMAEMLALVRRAEERGVASVWMAEHLGYRDAVSASMAFLAASSRITVVPTAVSVYSRHPMIAAMTAATLEETAPGRTIVSLASGNPRALGEIGLTADRPVVVTREYVEVLRALWSGQPVTRKGEVFQLQEARLHLPPARPIPLYLAAMGPRMLELAGEVADGVVLSAGLSAPYIRHSLARVAAGARRAGRAPGAVTAVGFVLAAVAADPVAARRAAGKMLAYLFRNRFIAENLEMSGVQVDRAAVADAAARGDWDTALRLMPDDVVAAHAVAGTIEDCRARLPDFQAAGLDVVVLLAVGDTEARQRAVDLAARW